MYIKVPSGLSEHTVGLLIREIESCDGCDSEITVDFSDLRIAYPIGSLVFAQYLKYNKDSRGRILKFISSDTHTNPISYLEYVGFFKFFGENPPQAVQVPTNKTYVPMGILEKSNLLSLVYDEKLNGRKDYLLQDAIEMCSDNYSQWMFDKVEPVFSYCFREIIRNVFEHTGCLYCSVFGQIYPKRDEVEICIADSGRGIRNSLSEKYGEQIDDEWALKNAILPGITSESVKNSGKYDNSGFGLYVLSKIAERFGYMWIGSCSKMLKINHQGVKVYEGCYPGTFVGINFRYSSLLRNRTQIQDIINEGERLSQQLGIYGKASTSTKDI